MPIDVIATASTLIPFTIPPSVCALRNLLADPSSQCALDVHPEQLELTR
jgi:hypothetical protein